MSLCPPQIPSGLFWVWTQTSGVIRWQLIAWAILPTCQVLSRALCCCFGSETWEVVWLIYLYCAFIADSLCVPHNELTTLSLINFSLQKYLFLLLCAPKPIFHWQHTTRDHTLHIICVTSILIINNLLYLQQINISVKENAIASRFLILEY